MALMPDPFWNCQTTLPVSASTAMNSPVSFPVNSRPPPVASIPDQIWKSVSGVRHFFCAKPAVGGKCNLAIEITIEARDDPHQRGLPPSGRPDQRGDFSAAKAEHKLAEHVELPAGGGAKRLLLDVDVKPASGASGRHVVQAAAPEMFRLPA